MMANKRRDPVKKEPLPAIVSSPFLEDLRRMIEETRQGLAGTVNATLTMLFDRRVGEETPVGMILYAGKKQEQIELLELGRSGIHVAEYLTDSLQKEVLQTKLRKAVALARNRLENRDAVGFAENVGSLWEGD